MFWYSHLFQNFPQFIVMHTVKGFGKVNKAEIDVFLELSCFFDDREEPPLARGRGGSLEEQPYIQGATAARAQEGQEELLHVQGQEGRP